jgi:hypothetical protein
LTLFVGITGENACRIGAGTKIQVCAAFTFEGRSLMSTELVGEIPEKAAMPWPKRAGTSGKLLAGGAALGVIAAFLPLASVSMDMMGGMMKGGGTVMVIDNWRGVTTLLGSLACGAFAFLLYPPARSPAKNLCWAAVGVGVVVALLALWLLILAMRMGGGADMMGMATMKSSMGIGGVVNLVAGAGMAAGAILKGRDERLF